MIVSLLSELIFSSQAVTSAVIGLVVFVLARLLYNNTGFYLHFVTRDQKQTKSSGERRNYSECDGGQENGGCCKKTSPGSGTGSGCIDKSSGELGGAGAGRKVSIVYGTTTGKSKLFSEQLALLLRQRGLTPQVLNCSEFGSNIEDKMKEISSGENPLLIVLISTYTEGSPPESARWFYSWLSDTAGDFRVSHNYLSRLQHCVFGLGNSLYSGHYNTVARDTDSFLSQLGSARLLSVWLGDENVDTSKTGSIESDFQAWADQLAGRVERVGPAEEDQEELEDEASSEGSEAEDDIVDLEDLGEVMKKARTKPAERKIAGEPKEMVTPLLRKTLTKQGYKIIGTHSGVKLCRWTKSMLRGRGGCYKHTFYGIESHRCMEATPSLACANKCVFCWRHHSNPVGTDWRWKMEPAEFIFAGAVENHRKMINEFKGVPGVIPDKLEEGMTVRHCALSLVGEPIMYPEISKFVRLLHAEKISSFLVTNAQFPEAIRDLDPCTQLYVSVDASTKESLKKIDRPLFKDFWERFLESLAELKKKGQRTVYRLTLVKGWNAEEMDNYASLVSLGKPDFIEIKGVTFCGSSKASSLTMENVPWHSEVVRFVSDLVDRLEEYEISCEHEHSNCVLVANKKFKQDGQWMTWIDYDKFHSLVSEYQSSGQSFTSLDYMAPTPAWAVFGATEQGFDPREKRWFRKGKAEVNVEGGCG